MGSDACDLVIANLSAYQDGELDVDQQQILENHLAQCTHCAAVLEAIKATDSALEREWRESAPLPSSLEFAAAVDGIIDALPPVPAQSAAFKARRVHARTRWMRFATGIMSLFTLWGLLWISYAVGYANGRKSLSQQSPEWTSAALTSNPQTLLSATDTSSLSTNRPTETSAPPPITNDLASPH